MGIRPCRRAKQLRGRRDLDDAAEIHDHGAVRDVLDHAEVVADEEIGEASSSRSRMNRFSTCALIDTSSAATDSSHTRKSGSTASARAMPMRARWPPEIDAGSVDL